MKIKLLILLFLCVEAKVFAQNDPKDWSLISNQDFKKKEFAKKQVNFLFIGNNPIIRYNPISLSLGGLMYFYQKIVSPQISAGCPYEISCSNFSIKSISEYGIIKGVALTADRLMRCNKVAAYDIHPIDITDEPKVHDPVERYRWKKKRLPS